MNEFYARVPETTDNEGSFIRILGNNNEAISGKEAIKLINNSSVIKATNSQITLKSNNNHELTIQLPSTSTSTLGWIWIVQPQYRPKDTIKGFVVVRERINTYMSALRACTKEGRIRLYDIEAKKTISNEKISLKDIVSTFEFKLSEHMDVGNYSIDVMLKDAVICSSNVRIDHYQKNDICVQVEMPSWIMKDDTCDMCVSASYFHGDTVKSGKIEIKMWHHDNLPQAIPFIKQIENGNSSFSIDDLKCGTYTIEITATDDANQHGKYSTSLVVAESPIKLQIQTDRKRNIYTKIPHEIKIFAKNPVDSPIPEHPIYITWTRKGKMDEKIVMQKTYYTGLDGIVKIDQLFDHEGMYQLLVETELDNERFQIVDSFSVNRLVQGMLNIKMDLDKKEVIESEKISGSITINGHDDTIKGIKRGYIDLITDRIVETKEVEIIGEKTAFSFEGVIDFYGRFAVEFYLYSHDNAVNIIAETDDAHCVVERIEGTIKSKASMELKMHLDAPEFATTGQEINLHVSIDNDRMIENFHIFGALIDKRILISHIESNLAQTFLELPQAMKINVLKSKQTHSDYYTYRSYGASLQDTHYLSSRGSYDGSSRYSASCYAGPPMGPPPRAGAAPSSRGIVKGIGMESMRNDMFKTLNQLLHISPSKALYDQFAPFVQFIRKNFAESVIINPHIIENNKTDIKVTLPDSITEYVIMLFGAGINQFSSLHKDIHVKNPIFTTIANPSSVVYGDEFDIAITVHNTTESEIKDAQIMIHSMKNIAMMHKSECIKLDVKPKSTESVSIRVKAESVGYAELEIELEADNFAEIMHFDQPMYVKPPNSPIISASQQYIAQDLPAQLDWKVDKDSVHAIGEVAIMLSMETAIIDGWESLIQYPHGCCEQTCASTLPNLIVYLYLESKNELTESMKEKLIGNMQDGFNKLMKYHNSDGGFSYWGGESSVFYTALAISTIAQMRKYLKNVPDDLFESAYGYLGRNKKSELWAGADGHATTAPVKLEKYGMNAFILYSLAQAGIRDESAFQWMLDRKSEYAHDPTVMAMMLYVMGNSDQNRAVNFAMELVNIAEEKNEILMWKQGSALTRSGDYSVESTAYALLAIKHVIGDNAEMFGVYDKGIKYILSQRKSDGWGSTRDTLMASLAISQVANAIKPDFTLKVVSNGKIYVNEKIDSSNLNWKIFNLQHIYIDNLAKGKNSMHIEMQGKGRCHAALACKQWKYQRNSEAKAPFTVNRKILDDAIEFEIVPKGTIYSVIVEQSIPTIFEVQGNIQANDAEHVEIKDGICNIFFAQLSEKKTIRIPIVRKQGKCTVESAKIYEMYNPESRVITESVIIQ